MHLAFSQGQPTRSVLGWGVTLIFVTLHINCCSNSFICWLLQHVHTCKVAACLEVTCYDTMIVSSTIFPLMPKNGCCIKAQGWVCVAPGRGKFWALSWAFFKASLPKHSMVWCSSDLLGLALFCWPRQKSFCLLWLEGAVAATFELPWGELNSCCSRTREAGPAGAASPSSSLRPWGAKLRRESTQEAPTWLFCLPWRRGWHQRATRFCVLLELLHRSSTSLSVRVCTISQHVPGRGIPSTLAPFSRHFWVLVCVCV